VTGSMLAIMMSNAGGAWDNCKCAPTSDTHAHVFLMPCSDTAQHLAVHDHYCSMATLKEQGT
jgi:Na+/H+-translocating membrane pyrophosphatase